MTSPTISWEVPPVALGPPEAPHARKRGILGAGLHWQPGQDLVALECVFDLLLSLIYVNQTSVDVRFGCIFIKLSLSLRKCFELIFPHLEE